MASKLWLALCLVLFAYNLIELIGDRHLLNFKIVEEGDAFFDKDGDLNYLFCSGFNWIKNKGFLTDNPPTKNVSVKIFLNYSIASIEGRLNVTGLFRVNESYIFNDHVCFPTTKSELQKEGKPFNEFLEIYQVLNLFIYSKEMQPNFYDRAYLKGDHLPSIYIKGYKQKIFGLNHLRNSDCLDRANHIHYDRFACLNRCFVRLKMRAGFYHFNDDAIFDLSEIITLDKKEAKHPEKSLGVTKINTLNAIVGAKECLKECPERSCFLEVIITLRIEFFYYRDFLQKEEKDKVDLNLNTYTAFYSIDDFNLQLFSLFVLFTGTSIQRLIHALLALTAVKVKGYFKNFENVKNQKLRRALLLAHPVLKYTLTLLSIVFVLIQGLNMINEFRFQSSHPNRTATLNFSSEPFSVVLCFPIENWMGDGEIKEGRNSEILRNYTFTEIEEHSRKLIRSEIDNPKIYAVYELIGAKWQYSDEVLFKSSKFNGHLCLSRCFRLDFDLEDERYRKIPLTYLLIAFRTKYRELFLIERTQNFTSGLINFPGLYYPQKVTKKYSKKSKKSNCGDYSEEEGCDSKKNCFERCLSRTFIERHGSIPTNTVVSKSDLHPSWLENERIYFNEIRDEKPEKECAAQFNQTDCNEVSFEESPDLAFLELRNNITIRLSYMNILEQEMEYEFETTLLKIVSLETIFFGSNALAILTTVFLYLSRTFRFKWHRAYSLILFLVAGIGFLVHNTLVFQSIINGDLNENEFFEKPEQYHLPSPILCFEMKPGIDENHRFTGEYLDELTDTMTFQHAFRAIVHNNRTHEKYFDIDRLNFTNSNNFYSSPELELTHFFYPGLKCFKISLKVSYKEEDFFLLKDKIVLRIYLNRTFKEKHSKTYFIHQQADSSEIGGGFEYKLGKRDNDSYYIYNVEFELFKIVRNDQFEILKDPRRLFKERVEVNDAKSKDSMRKQFKDDHNLTMSKPLNRNFDAEVDNDLFDQYSKTLSEQASFKSLNFEQNVANTYINVFYPKLKFNYPDFACSFSFLVRRVEITNSENYTKLVVSLLNTLSLWLEICILDMGAWLSRIFKLVLHFYCLLIRISNRLNSWRK